MATLEQRVSDLARKVAQDQIKQDIENNEKFVHKNEIEVGGWLDLSNRLLVLEGQVSRLIPIVWKELPIEPLSLQTNSDSDEDAFSVRLSALETKVQELIDKTWKQEAF